MAHELVIRRVVHKTFARRVLLQAAESQEVACPSRLAVVSQAVRPLPRHGQYPLYDVRMRLVGMNTRKEDNEDFGEISGAGQIGRSVG